MEKKRNLAEIVSGVRSNLFATRARIYNFYKLE